MEEEKGEENRARPYILKIITERNYIIIIGMKKAKILLFVTALVAVLTSCGGGQKGLPTSDEYPVITIGASNAQLKTTSDSVQAVE